MMHEHATDGWTWALQPPVPAGPVPRFGSQDEAEDWLRGQWEDLAEAGAGAVSLLDGAGTVVYTMPLAA